MNTTQTTSELMIERIERQATGAFGYNPVAVVDCPHCTGRMYADDAKAHVRTFARWCESCGSSGHTLCNA